MTVKNIDGVPDYECDYFHEKRSDYCILIPVINEGSRIHAQLIRAHEYKIDFAADIILCDAGSTDGSMQHESLRELGVCAVLTKTGAGRQGAQLRMGMHEALKQGYKGVITIDGNNKDSIESVPLFIEKLEQGCDFVQGSRFIKGGVAENTPLSRLLAVKLLHAPVISLTARHRFTDTTNNFRAYSVKYLTHSGLLPFRDVFSGYELLAYLSVRATQLGLKACEVPVARRYPAAGKIPTKIKGIKGNTNLLSILFKNAFGVYNPK